MANKRINFIVGFKRDKKCGVYVAKVLNLPGCMSQGRTLKEAEENIQDAIDACLDARRSEMRSFRRAVVVSTILKGKIGQSSFGYK